MQDGIRARKPRHSDGGSTLPPISTPRSGKKGSRKKKGLGTISAPLTPQGSGPLEGTADACSPSNQHQQQPNKLSIPHSSSKAITPSRLGRRNTQSDTGQIQQQQQPVFLQQHSLSSGEHSSSVSQHSNGVLQQPGSNSIHSPGVTHAGNGPKVVKQLQWQQQLQQPLQPQPLLQQPLPLPPQQQQQQAPILSGPPPPAGPPALPQGPFSTGAPTACTGAAAVVPRVGTLQHAGSLEGPYLDPPPTLWEFFYAEATPHEKYPTADVLWRQTERDRVYNFLLYVPYQLERIMIFGTLLCFYSFLGALTVLPLRCLWALWQMLTNLLLPGRRSRQPGSNSSSNRPSLLPGAQLYDLLCALLMLAAVLVLSQIKPGVLYYWMKDITSEFLKIQVLFTALEILDKILSNFGVDVLEALSSTCTLYTQSSIGLMQLLSDLLVAFLLITAHGSVLMCQAMVFAVTMNSKRNALLALMIATNFVELKGQVYKRTDTNKLWALACQDIVERFQLLLVLCFVVVEDISNSGTWWPAPTTLLECGRIFLWEIVIDITKHAVLGKFNDIRPGIYREYMRDLCSDSLDKHSHNTHKLVGFCPLGPAALSLRMVHTLFTLKCDGRPDWQWRRAVLLMSWLAACGTQVVLGYSLKWLAYLYVQHHTLQAGGKALPRAINVTPSGIKLFAPSGAPTAVSTAIKGSSAAAAAGGTTGGAATGSTVAVPAVPTTPAVSVSPLTAGFSPKGVQSRVTGAAGATQGGSPLSGVSPTHSPKGVHLLAAQLQMPVGIFNSGVGGRPGGGLEHLHSGLQMASSGPQSFPGMGPSLASTLTEPADVQSGPMPLQLQHGAAQDGQHIPGLVLGAGNTSNSSTAGSFGGGMNGVMANPAMLTASLAANSAPSAAGMGVTVPATAAAVAGVVGPNLQTLSMPPRIGVSLNQRAGSRPDSPFSPNSQMPFADRQVDARASFSDARPGWDTGSSTLDPAGATLGAALAESMFASKEAPAAVSSSSDTVGVPVAGGSAPVTVAASKAASAGHSSSYSELSAGGLVGRGYSRHNSDLERHAQHEQQQQEQGWQQPKHRHRAKRE